MRAAAILGLGCSAKNLKPFQIDPGIDWRIGMPAATDEADIVLIFGGDGTIHRYLGQLVRLGVPVLVVPSGSGNDFARALGLRSGRDSLGAWRRFCASQHNIRVVDLGVITPLEITGESSAPHESAHYFCTVAGVGIDGEVCRRADALPRWLRGHGGYALALAPSIFRFPPVAVRIFAPDDSGGWASRTDKPVMLAAFANTSTYGGGMKIAPKARMDDGQLDVCLIAGLDPFRLFCMFPTVYFGRHLNVGGVESFRAASLRVESESPRDVYADGEFVCSTPVEVSVQAAALKVLTP